MSRAAPPARRPVARSTDGISFAAADVAGGLSTGREPGTVPNQDRPSDRPAPGTAAM